MRGRRRADPDLRDRAVRHRLHLGGLERLVRVRRGLRPGAEGALPRRQAAQHVTESARAHSYILSKEVPTTCQFWLLTLWLLTFWMLTVNLRVFLTLFSDFVYF